MPPPPYGAPSPYAAPVYAGAPRTDGLAIASLVVSIIGLPGIFCFGILGLILGGVGFFLGRSSLNRIRASGGAVGGAGLAQAGWIVGVVAAVLGALYFIYIVVVFAIAVSNGIRNTP